MTYPYVYMALFGALAIGGGVAADEMLPLDLEPYMGAVRSQVAEMRDAPSETSKLAGYLAGAVSVGVDYANEKDGWMLAAPEQFRTARWMRRSDLVMRDDLVPWKGGWPVRFVFFVSEVGDFIEFFPADNRCRGRVEPAAFNHFRSELGKLEGRDMSHVTLASVRCKELWHAPRTDVYYRNPGAGSFAWFDPKSGVLGFYSYAEPVAYEYADGHVGRPEYPCYRPAVACSLNQEKPSMTKPPYPPRKTPWAD